MSKTKETTKTKPVEKQKAKPSKTEETIKSVDQLSIQKAVANTLGIPLSVVTDVVELEQKLTMAYVRSGCKVIKKNYVTFTPIKKPAYTMTSKLDGEQYHIPERITIKAKPGLGFKVYVSDQVAKMPDKICRFVDQKDTKAVSTTETKVA
jgi:hypothetical protein